MLMPPSRLSKSDLRGEDQHPIRVLLIRQVSVEVKERKVLRSSILGVGRISPIPPLAALADGPGPDSSEINLDWEGTVQCRGEVVAVGFRAGNLLVKVGVH